MFVLQFWTRVISNYTKKKSVKNISILGKFSIWLPFNPGLVLTSFWTTQPRIIILIDNARYLKPFFLGGRRRNNQRKSNSVWYNTPHWKIIALICCARRSPKVILITVICQHCGVKISTVTPSFYYVFNISLSCNINIPSFMENLWWDLLLGNHLKWSWACRIHKDTQIALW